METGASLQKQSGFSQARLYVWIKGLESKVNNLLRETGVLKSDFIKRANSLKREVATLNDDLLEMRSEQEKLHQTMDIIIKELKRTAGKEEIMTLQKYVNLWSPLHFATQQDVERMVEEKFSEMKTRRRSKKHK